jgi:protein gp37
MSTTKIEWCDYTINPIVGCSKCSPGCDNCYAQRFAARMAMHPNTKIAGKYTDVVDAQGHWNSRLRRMKNNSRIFLGSMTDFFHEDGQETTDELIQLLGLISAWPEHTFCVLTKRPKLMRNFFQWIDSGEDEYFYPNLWLGITVCNQYEADAKIPILLEIPAAKCFVSIEPMLGPVDLRKYIDRKDEILQMMDGVLRIMDGPAPDQNPAGVYISPSLDWVICGGETGSGARPMCPEWVRGLRDQCQGAGVPFFFKSWGEWGPDMVAPVSDSYRWPIYPDEPKGGRWSYRVGKKRAGRLLDGREWNEAPQSEELKR